MLIVGLIFAAIAAGIHLFFFSLESLRWSHPKTAAAFGLRTPAEIEATKPLAFNQGFYNLFIAVGTLLGIVIVAAGALAVGGTLILSNLSVMFLAGLVLRVSLPRMARASYLQMAPPALGIVFVAVGLAA